MHVLYFTTETEPVYPVMLNFWGRPNFPVIEKYDDLVNGEGLRQFRIFPEYGTPCSEVIHLGEEMSDWLHVWQIEHVVTGASVESMETPKLVEWPGVLRAYAPTHAGLRAMALSAERRAAALFA